MLQAFLLVASKFLLSSVKGGVLGNKSSIFADVNIVALALFCLGAALDIVHGADLGVLFLLQTWPPLVTILQA